MIQSRYINPFTDFGFKKIFGEEPNKDLLIDFLNELLKEQNVQIKTLTYNKNEHVGATDLDRKVIFDLYCENEKGEKFIVELQKAKQTFFKDRTIFYSTFPIQEQAIKGEWNYELKAVYVIAILDFTFDDNDKDRAVVNIVQLIDNQTQKVFYDKLSYVFVQMPNFTKTIDELETHLDKWFYVLRHLKNLDRIPEKIKDKIFKKVFNIAEYVKLSEEERSFYEDSLKYYRDLKNSLDTAEADGFKKAEEFFKFQLKKERQEKIKERREKEKERREKEKERKEKENALKKITDLAKLLKNMQVSIDEICKQTGLSKEEIENL